MLAGLVFWLVKRGPVAAEPVAEASDMVQETRTAEALVPEHSQTASNTIPFRWSELESTDYRTYVSNLRRVGCPEETLGDILKADVDSVYAPRREQIERAAGGGSMTREQGERQLAALREEEASFLASLLGDAQVTAKAALPKETPAARRNARPVLPLACGEIDPTALQLNESQMAVIKEVREKFQEEIGVQDPNDPAYLGRWNTAQRKADDRLRGLLGSKIYIQCQLQAANQIAASKPQ